MPVFELTPMGDETPISQNEIIQPKTPQSCPNCNTIITCGCQWTQASDGSRVCEDCLEQYELKLGEK